jgi:Small Multidrug Resistance protein
MLAGLVETVGATAMKASSGFTRPGAVALTIVAADSSFALLRWSLRELPASLALSCRSALRPSALIGCAWRSMSYSRANIKAKPNHSDTTWHRAKLRRRRAVEGAAPSVKISAKHRTSD